MSGRCDADRVLLHVEKAKDAAEAERVRRALWTVEGVYAVQFSQRDRVAVVHAEGGESKRAALVDALKQAGFGFIDATLDRVDGFTWANARADGKGAPARAP